MKRIVETLFKLLPLIFALGFLTPVFNQALISLHFQPPLSLSTLAFSMMVALSWGLIACVKRRWM